MNRSLNRRVAAMCGVALVLTACGGGGGDESAGQAEGFWVGSTSTGYTAQVAILEDGQAWGLYTTGSTIIGALAGTASASGGSISGSGSDYYFPGGTATPGSFSGTFTPRGTMTITTGSGARFTGTYSGVYDTPASLTAAAGAYAGAGVIPGFASYATNVTVDANGVATATSVACSGSGTAAPRGSGKNVFNITLTFTGASCPLTNAGAISGIAYYDAATSSLIAMGRNGSKSTGFFWAGVK